VKVIPLKIALDLDGVLAEPMVIVCESLSKKAGRRITLDDITQWDPPDLIALAQGNFGDLLNDVWLNDWERIPTTEPELSRKVCKLKEHGRVDIVTGRSSHTVRVAKLWLERYEVPYDNFVRVPGSTGKLKLDYNVYVDDAPRLMELLASTLDKVGIVYTKPWNRNVMIRERIFRANDLGEVDRIIGRLAEGLHGGTLKGN